jgi:hypothetical protein
MLTVFYSIWKILNKKDWRKKESKKKESYQKSIVKIVRGTIEIINNFMGSYQSGKIPIEYRCH